MFKSVLSARCLLTLLLTFIIFSPAEGRAMDKPAEPATSPITAESTIDEIRTELKTMNIPVLDFTLENGDFPTCEYVEHPAGCNGYSIVNNEYVKGSFTISIGDNVVYESGEYVNKESGVRLKVRGNTSSYDGVLKKSYKVKLSKKADLLLRDDKKLKDKDWVLLGLGSKKLNYVAGTETGRICGMPWEPEGRHVVVIINDQYMGTYYLVEAVSAGSHRVDIAESGYIVENDAYWWKPEEVYFKSIHQRYDLGWTFKEPDTDDFHEMSLENVKWAINNIEHHLYNGKDVTDFIDYESFANWLLAHDIIMTTDGYGSNIFVTKADFDPISPYSTKFKMGPLWDFDTSLTMNVKEHTPITTLPGFWYHLLSKDPVFDEMYKDRWREIRDTLKEHLLSKVEDYVTNNPDIYRARQIDFNRGLIGESEVNHPVDDYNDIEDWMNKRIPILNSLILGEESGTEDINISEDKNPTQTTTPSQYNVNGIKHNNGDKGIVITVGANGKTTKALK